MEKYVYKYLYIYDCMCVYLAFFLRGRYQPFQHKLSSIFRYLYYILRPNSFIERKTCSQPHVMIFLCTLIQKPMSRSTAWV